MLKDRMNLIILFTISIVLSLENSDKGYLTYTKNNTFHLMIINGQIMS